MSKKFTTGAARPKVTFNNWWGDEEDEEFQEGKASASTFWRKYWNTKEDSVLGTDGREDPQIMARHLREIRNTCHIVFWQGNLNVQWASDNDSFTDITSGQIRISPFPLLTTEPNYNAFDIGHRIDVVHAIALHEGAHNAYTPSQAMAQAYSIGGELLSSLFNLVEDGYIEHEVTHEFPGFNAYFNSSSDFHFNEHEVSTRINAVRETDYRFIDLEERETQTGKELLEKQFTHLINLIIASCKKRGEVDVTPLYGISDRHEEVVRITEDITELYNDCEVSGIPYTDRLDAAKIAYTKICNFFRPSDDKNNPDMTMGEAQALADALGLSSKEIQESFKDGGVDPSSGRFDKQERDDIGRPKDSSTVTEATANRVAGLMEANLREENLEDFHTGTAGKRHTKIQVVDMRLYPYAITRYNELKRKTAKEARKLQRIMQFRSEDSVFIERETEHGKVDRTRLYKLAAMNEKDIFYKKTRAEAPKVHLGLLLDESGSMGGSVSTDDGYISKSDVAVQTAIMITSAIANTKGVSYEVWGHSGDFYGHYTTDTIESEAQEGYTPIPGVSMDGPVAMKYLDSRNGITDLRVLGRITHRSQNYDGLAVDVVSKSMISNAPGDRKVLFVVCDGMPAGYGYEHPYGIEDTQKRVAWARKHGVEVISIFVGGLGAARDQMIQMYGPEGKGWFHCSDPAKLPRVMESMSRQALRWERL